MDIGHNLSYNEDTVHSGSFPEGPAGFGRETMCRVIIQEKVNHTEDGRQDRMRNVRCTVRMAVLFVCVMLCGCTRREQLVLETGREAGTEQAADERQEQTGSVAESEGIQTQGDNVNLPLGQAASESNGAQRGTEQTADRQEAEQISQEVEVIWVHVCGAVKNPDVYELPAGSRVYEAVKQAGGFTEEADESYVNQAQILADGAKLVIPTTEQTQAMAQGDQDGNIGIIDGETIEAGALKKDVVEGGTNAAGAKININTATQAQLCEIPGIGATRAAAIAAYRQEHGAFARIEDIMNVSGIKEGTYVKIKDSITVN